jgi:hypothetical protein
MNSGKFKLNKREWFLIGGGNAQEYQIFQRKIAMKGFITTITLLFLVGCATGIDPKSLAKSNSQSKFILQSDIEYSTKISMLESGTEALKKGEYVATYEDKNGIFFLGPKKCVVIKGANGLVRVNANGGLWYPKNNVKMKPKIFAFIERENNPRVDESGALINALIEQDYGRVSFGKGISDKAFLDNVDIISL